MVHMCSNVSFLVFMYCNPEDATLSGKWGANYMGLHTVFATPCGSVVISN